MDNRIENLLKSMFFTLIPLILTNSLGILKYISNTFLVGNLIGEKAISVLSNTFAITLIFYSIPIAFSIAISVLISQTYSNKEDDYYIVKSKEIANNGYSFAIFVGLITALIIFIFKKYFLIILNTPKEIFVDSEMFLLLFSISLVPNFLQRNINEGLRVLGKPNIPLIFTGMNVFFNNIILFILIKYEFRILSIGLANILSDVIILLISLIIIRNNSILKINFNLLYLSSENFNKFLNIGIPIVFEQIIVSFVILFETYISNFAGIIGNSAFGIVGRWEEIFFVFSQSIQSVIIIFVSRNYLKNDKNIINSTIKNGFFLMILPVTIFILLIFVFTHFSCSIFLKNEEIVSLAVKYFKIAGIAYCIMPLDMIFNGYIIGSGNTKFLFVTNIIACFLEISTVFILKKYYLNLNSISYNEDLLTILGCGIIIYTLTTLILNAIYFFFKKIDSKS